MELDSMVLNAFILTLLLYLFSGGVTETHTLTVEVIGLRNAQGVIQISLYNREGTLPDEKFKNYYKIGKADIEDGQAEITFRKLPAGMYAASVLHDENMNGKIDKGLVRPKEGIGFSNYKTIGLKNRPNFEKASFKLCENTVIAVKMIYL